MWVGTGCSHLPCERRTQLPHSADAPKAVSYAVICTPSVIASHCQHLPHSPHKPVATYLAALLLKLLSSAGPVPLRCTSVGRLLNFAVNSNYGLAVHWLGQCNCHWGTRNSDCNTSVCSMCVCPAACNRSGSVQEAPHTRSHSFDTLLSYCTELCSPPARCRPIAGATHERSATIHGPTSTLQETPNSASCFDPKLKIEPTRRQPGTRFTRSYCLFQQRSHSSSDDDSSAGLSVQHSSAMGIASNQSTSAAKLMNEPGTP